MTSSGDSVPTRPSAQLNEAERLQRLVREQQETIRANQENIQAQQETIQALHQTIEQMERQMQQQERIEQLEAEVRDHKKLKGKPKYQSLGVFLNSMRFYKPIVSTKH